MKRGENNLGSVFQIPDLWAPSRFIADTATNKSLLFKELTLKGNNIQSLPLIDPAQHGHIFFGFPNQPSVPYSYPLLDLKTSKASHGATDVIQEQRVDDYDFWLLDEDAKHEVVRYKSWDRLDNCRYEQFITPYITEAGSAIFDAAVGAHEDYLGIANDDYVLINSKTLSSSLLALGLGRNSVLFTWNEERHTFIQVIPKLRISGFTGDTLVGLMAIFFECGNITKSLQKYVDKCYSEETSPAQIALAHSVNSLLKTLQSQLGGSTLQQKSILYLQTKFKPAHSILNCFQQLINNTATSRSDESLLSTIFEDIQILEDRTDSLRNILLEIFVRVSQPWLGFINEWLGLQRETGLPISKKNRGKSLVRVENDEWLNYQGFEHKEPDYLLDLDRIPSFISPDDARTIFEVGRSLRFLRAHHPNHPLAKGNAFLSITPPSLKWNFSTRDLDNVENNASQYEEKLKNLLRGSSKDYLNFKTSICYKHSKPAPDCTSLNFFGKSEEDIQTAIINSISLFDRPFPNEPTQDDLSVCIKAHLNLNEKSEYFEDSLFMPPISLAPALSFKPIIAAQARIVNGICMKIFFNSHKLRQHLSLQKDFQLFGNGVFSSRLFHAILNPDTEKAKKRQFPEHSGAVLGLRLDGRNMWPPASSELQLSLVDILSESYKDIKYLSDCRILDKRAQKSLPGDLSFALREMSDEEISDCMNPDSLEALDFLRLSYQPPAPLDAVITNIILYKYDQLFKFLLRVIRMLYVVSSLFRNTTCRNLRWRRIDYIAQRFRIEAHHFVYTVSAYFFDTGINATWRIFEAKLNQIENYVNTSEDLNLGHNEGLDKLRDYHERVVDRIMFILLLRKRQKPVLNLLEEIFGLVLQFSIWARNRSLDCLSRDSDVELNEMYLTFKKKVSVFITVLKGLSEKKGYGEKRSLEERGNPSLGMFEGDDLVDENTVIQLLTRLEMSDYFENLDRSKYKQ